MLKLKKISLLSAILASIVIGNPAYPCFDTFLFVQQKSMVYPEGYLAVDTLGEYSVNSASVPGEDTAFYMTNVYYGISESFSIQAGFGSGEKQRESYQVDDYGIKGVANLISGYSGIYYLDTILECRTMNGNRAQTYNFSMPNIFRSGNYIAVVHPSAEAAVETSTDLSLGIHGGLFYNFQNSALIGIGGEYGSAQSGSAFSKRIVDGEAAMSLFLGAEIGNLYLQNEFAKGLMNSRDFGFAVTVKAFLDLQG